MQTMTFVLREGLNGLVRARLTGLVATGTVAISLVLFGVFLIVATNLGRLVEYLRSRVELEVFLDDSIDRETIKELSDRIKSIEGVEHLVFISKDSAVQEFRRLFEGGQAESYFATLGYNPLPASFRVQLTEDFRNSKGAESVFRTIASAPRFRQEDVVYRSKYLITLEKYVNVAVGLGLLVGVIVIVSALLLVSNNIRLIISSKKKIIDTMKLVGATDAFVRVPLFIQGIVQGILGGAISALFLYLLVSLVDLEIPDYVRVGWQIYLIIINLGVLLGAAGSSLAIRKYL